MRKNRSFRRSKNASSSEAVPAKRRFIQTTFTISSSTKDQRTTATTQKKQSLFEESLCLFLTDAMLPFSVVENEKFLNMISLADPDLHVPSRRTIIRHVLTITSKYIA